MNQMAPRVVGATLLAVATGSSTHAQDRPDFSGRWALDTAATAAGPLRPLAMTETIQRHGDTIIVSRSAKSAQGDVSTTFTVGLDGKAWKNHFSQGGLEGDMSTTCRWADTTLVLTSAIAVSGQEFGQVERWTLDASGKTLTSEHDVETMGQRLSVTLIFRRQ